MRNSNDMPTVAKLDVNGTGRLAPSTFAAAKSNSACPLNAGAGVASRKAKTAALRTALALAAIFVAASSHIADGDET